MRVIAKRTLREFWEKHADSEQQLKAWYNEAEQVDWKTLYISVILGQAYRLMVGHPYR